MAKLTENAIWEDEVYMIQRNDPVGGGPNGPVNKPHQSLANRTQYLKENLDILAEQVNSGFILASSFEKGYTLTLANEVLLFEQDGQYYRWTGDLPKVVDANSTPDTAGGIGGGKWVLVGDGALRSQLATNDGAKMIGTESGGNVEQSLKKTENDIKNLYSATDRNSSNLNLTISEQIRDLSESIQDEVMTYDAFGNTVFFDNNDLFCFYRSESHYTLVDTKSKVCIGIKDLLGNIKILWEIESEKGIGYRDPKLTPDLIDNKLILSYQIYDVVNNKYETAIIGFVDLDHSGEFLSYSEVIASEYFLWGNVIRNPEGFYLATRYNRNNQNVQLIKSSDRNLNQLTTWNTVKDFFPSDFPNKTGINEVCIGYYKNMLVAVFRTMSSLSALSSVGFSRTNDITGSSGWVSFNLDASLAGPYIEAYTRSDNPLMIVGAADSNNTRSQVKAIFTYNCILFTPAINIQNLNTFNAYASIKLRSTGVYDLLSFYEDVALKTKTRIYSQTIFTEKTSVAKNENKYWKTSFITRPVIGDVSVINDWITSNQLFIIFNAKANGIIGIQIIIKEMESTTTLTPILYNQDNAVFASFKEITIQKSNSPQIVDFLSNASEINFTTNYMLRLDFGCELKVGSFNTSKNTITLEHNTPFSLFNGEGLSGSAYLLCGLITA